MATKKKEEKPIEVVEGDNATEEEAVVVVPEFGFPVDRLGNSWHTFVKRPVYYAEFIEYDFTFGGVTYKGGYAVCDDDGNEFVVSTEDFGTDYVAFASSNEHQPQYLLERALNPPEEQNGG